VPTKLTEAWQPGLRPCASAPLDWAACPGAFLPGNRRPRTAPLQRTGSGLEEGAVPASLRGLGFTGRPSPRPHPARKTQQLPGNARVAGWGAARAARLQGV